MFREKDVLEIPLTSDSPEAISILSDQLFFKTKSDRGRIYGFQTDINPAIKKALEIDQIFVLQRQYMLSQTILRSNEEDHYLGRL